MDHHSPMHPLYGGKYGNDLIGYECGHCGALLTVAGNFSERKIPQLGAVPRIRRNLSHAKRRHAAKQRKRWLSRARKALA